MVRQPIASNDEAMLALEPQPTIVEQAYRAILEAICEGRLEPGERLTQESVAAKLSVSRQPVGQALLLLRQQKFLVEAGRRGLMVAPLDRDFMRQIYELRLALEPMAASLAAQRSPAEARERGEPIVARVGDARSTAVGISDRPSALSRVAAVRRAAIIGGRPRARRFAVQ